MAEHLTNMIPEEEIDKRIREMGEQISRDYGDESLFVVCILKGAAFFACELSKRITNPLTIDFMATSSYGSGMESSGTVEVRKDLDLAIEGCNVLIVEDIIDSGRTLHFLSDLFSKRGAKSVKLCALLDKPSRREVDVLVDYVGFTIPDKFVVGYGLDYDQKYRNLPYIASVELD